MKPILNQLKNQTYCRLMPSKIQGVGVFAIKSIPKGINPFKEFDNEETESLSLEELKKAKLHPNIMKMIYNFIVPANDGLFCIPKNGLHSLNMTWFLNHSSIPNMITKEGWSFITNKRIKIGEELTVDYRTYIS